MMTYPRGEERSFATAELRQLARLWKRPAIHRTTLLRAVGRGTWAVCSNHSIRHQPWWRGRRKFPASSTPWVEINPRLFAVLS